MGFKPEVQVLSYSNLNLLRGLGSGYLLNLIPEPQVWKVWELDHSQPNTNEIFGDNPVIIVKLISSQFQGLSAVMSSIACLYVNTKCIML